jgi:hypothetical protein
MPCRDGGEMFNDQTQTVENPKTLKQLKRMRSLLCSACRALELNKFDFDLNPELSEWWDDHKKEDAKLEKANLKKRLLKERIAEIVLKPFAKLTDEERRILKENGYI